MGNSQNNHFKELNRIDGMQTEFEWKIFPGFTTLGILEEIQKLTEGIQCEPEHFNDRIIFMSMKNDIAWRENGNTKTCVQNSIEVAKYARRFPCEVVGHSWDLDQKLNGTGPILINQTAIGTELQK